MKLDLDANNDGWLDLISANGNVNDYRPALPWRMPTQLLLVGSTVASPLRGWVPRGEASTAK